MKKGDIQKRQGFTIIEVILVLAIAGLIFLMMFIALPALNRSQRDAERRDDILTFLKKVKDYQTNNRGTLPSDWNQMVSEYMGGNFTDPNGSAYSLSVVNCGTSTPGDTCRNGMDSSVAFSSTLKIVKSATCNGEKAIANNNIRRIAVQYRLEGGGIFCANT